jgi:type I restriction enzyme, S subunit
MSSIMREDWVECELGDLLKLKNGFAFKASNYKNEGIPVFRIGDINDWIVSAKNAVKIEEKKIYDEYAVEKGDILIAMSGATTGKFGIYHSTEKAYQNQRVGNLKLYSENSINKSFVFYLLYSLKRDIEREAYGGAQPNISGIKIEALKTKLAPLPIQRAIVSKIEALFSDLDNGIANFKKAQEQLKIYRQAVLKKAFEGELTKEWRERQRTDAINRVSTAEELLKQIKEERQNHYNQQIEEWKKAVKEWEKNGKVGKKPNKPRIWNDVEDFTELEKSDFNMLPENWKWVKLGNIFQVFVGSTPSRKNNSFWVDGTINWVSSGEVAFNSIYTTKEKITESGLENTSTTVHPKGTVMLAMIGEGKTRGQSAILEVEACHNQNTAAIRVSEVGFEPEYLYHYLFLKYEKNRRVGSGNNQKALNQTRILEFDFPLCSTQEQTQIVQEIESRLSVCDKVEQSINESLEKAEALRQSILKKAFEGKLLSEAEIEQCKQAGDYEPASELLKKITNEKLRITKKRAKK